MARASYILCEIIDKLILWTIILEVSLLKVLRTVQRKVVQGYIDDAAEYCCRVLGIYGFRARPDASLE